MTPSERRLEEILGRIDGGALKGRFEAQHVFLGPWILDFFFPEVRLAIEVDGSIHLKPEQKERDRLKDADCARWDMTLLRVTNEEVSGDEDVLVRKLREAWAVATRRENKIIGKVVHQKGRVVEMATGELPDPPDRSQ